MGSVFLGIVAAVLLGAGSLPAAAPADPEDHYAALMREVLLSGNPPADDPLIARVFLAYTHAGPSLSSDAFRAQLSGTSTFGPGAAALTRTLLKADPSPKSAEMALLLMSLMSNGVLEGIVDDLLALLLSGTDPSRTPLFTALCRHVLGRLPEAALSAKSASSSPLARIVASKWAQLAPCKHGLQGLASMLDLRIADRARSRPAPTAPGPSSKAVQVFADRFDLNDAGIGAIWADLQRCVSGQDLQAVLSAAIRQYGVRQALKRYFAVAESLLRRQPQLHGANGMTDFLFEAAWRSYSLGDMLRGVCGGNFPGPDRRRSPLIDALAMRLRSDPTMAASWAAFVTHLSGDEAAALFRALVDADASAPPEPKWRSFAGRLYFQLMEREPIQYALGDLDDPSTAMRIVLALASWAHASTEHWNPLRDVMAECELVDDAAADADDAEAAFCRLADAASDHWTTRFAQSAPRLRVVRHLVLKGWSALPRYRAFLRQAVVLDSALQTALIENLPAPGVDGFADRAAALMDALLSYLQSGGAEMQPRADLLRPRLASLRDALPDGAGRDRVLRLWAGLYGDDVAVARRDRLREIKLGKRPIQG